MNLAKLIGGPMDGSSWLMTGDMDEGLRVLVLPSTFVLDQNGEFYYAPAWQLKPGAEYWRSGPFEYRWQPGAQAKVAK